MFTTGQSGQETTVDIALLIDKQMTTSDQLDMRTEHGEYRYVNPSRCTDLVLGTDEDVLIYRRNLA